MAAEVRMGVAGESGLRDAGMGCWTQVPGRDSGAGLWPLLLLNMICSELACINFCSNGDEKLKKGSVTISRQISYEGWGLIHLS